MLILSYEFFGQDLQDGQDFLEALSSWLLVGASGGGGVAEDGEQRLAVTDRLNQRALSLHNQFHTTIPKLGS